MGDKQKKDKVWRAQMSRAPWPAWNQSRQLEDARLGALLGPAIARQVVTQQTGAAGVGWRKTFKNRGCVDIHV